MKYDVHQIYFKTKEATQQQLEELFSLALQETCLSVNHFLYKPSYESDHVSLWAEGGYLDGLSEESHITAYMSNPQKVSPEVFVNVVREFYSEEEKKVEDIKLEEMETIRTVTEKDVGRIARSQRGRHVKVLAPNGDFAARVLDLDSGEEYPYFTLVDGVEIFMWEPEGPDYINWYGGECPVERTVLVEYNMLGYGKTHVAAAGSLRWKHINSSTDIVAYRVVSETTKPVTAVVDVHVTVPAVPHKVPVTTRKFTEQPRPRFRKRRQRQVRGKKPLVRIIYTDQSTYTFKNVKQVQVYDNKVYIAYQRQVAEGIVENAEVEIDGALLMGIVVQQGKNNAQIFHNIDKTWDFFDEHGTVIRGAFNITRAVE